MYTTTLDASVAIDNSGVNEWFYAAWFDGDNDAYDEKMIEVFEWMWRNDKTPAEAAAHFQVA